MFILYVKGTAAGEIAYPGPSVVVAVPGAVEFDASVPNVTPSVIRQPSGTNVTFSGLTTSTLATGWYQFRFAWGRNIRDVHVAVWPANVLTCDMLKYERCPAAGYVPPVRLLQQQMFLLRSVCSQYGNGGAPTELAALDGATDGAAALRALDRWNTVNWT